MEWLPTPVFLLGEFHGQRSLLGYSPWSFKELDTTEQLTHTHTHTHTHTEEDLDLNLCLMTLLLQLTILVTAGVTYKVTVSCLLHCISPTPIK